MRATERLTITIPVDLAQRLRETVSASGASSVSAFIRGLVQDRLEEENLATFLAELEARGAPSTDEDRRWAQSVVDAVRAGEHEQRVI